MHRLGRDRLDDLLLFLFNFLVVFPVAEDAELAGDAAVCLKHDAGKDLLTLLEPEPLDVEVSHPDAPGVMGRVLAIMRRDALGKAFEQVGDLPRLSHNQSGALEDLDPVAVRISDEAQPVAALADGVRRSLGLDPLLLELAECLVELCRRDRDVPVAGADLIRLGAPDVVGELEPRLGPVVGQPHEHVDRLVADLSPVLFLEPERLVEGDRAVDVGDPVAGVDQAHTRQGKGSLSDGRLRAVIVERSMNEQWLSNTYLVADELGLQAAMIDAGGPVEPLLDVLSRMRFQLSHVLLTHHHHDHVAELDRALRQHPQAQVLIHPLEREQVPQATGVMNPGEPIECGALTVEPLHTPGHTAGMLSLLVNGTDVFTGDTLFRGSVGGVRAPGHTTYADLKHSIMDTLLKLPAPTRIHPGHTDPTTVADELEHNPFVRIWRGLDTEGSEPCTALGKPATLILLAEDYDGGHKAWVRWPDGSDDIVPGSQVRRENS